MSVTTITKNDTLVITREFSQSREWLAGFETPEFRDDIFLKSGGGSVLNVFNTENIKISNFVRIALDQLTSINIHAEAVPFTPAIYLNLSF